MNESGDAPRPEEYSNNSESNSSRNSPPDDLYNLDTAVKLNATERRRLIQKAQKELNSLLQAHPNDNSTKIVGHETRKRTRDRMILIRDQHQSSDHKARHELETKLKKDVSHPSRSPEIPNQSNKNFTEAIASILSKNKLRPEASSLDDLNTIIDADTKDYNSQNDTFSQLSNAMLVAERAFKLSTKINKINVALSKNENGEWIAEPGFQKGKLYFTFERNNINYIKSQILHRLIGMDMLMAAKEALETIVNKKTLIENDIPAQGLYSYLEGRIQQITLMQSESKQSHTKKPAELTIALFRHFQKKVNTYRKTEIDFATAA